MGEKIERHGRKFWRFLFQINGAETSDGREIIFENRRNYPLKRQIMQIKTPMQNDALMLSELYSTTPRKKRSSVMQKW